MGEPRRLEPPMPTLHLLLVFSINLLNYLDRYLTAALLPFLQRELSLGYEQGGRIVSAFVLGYVVCAPFFGYLGDRWRKLPLMALGVVLWSAATALSAWGTSFALFFLTRVLVGVGEASFGTITPGYIKARIAEPVRLNNAMALFSSAIPIGAALGYLVGGVAAQQLSWRWAYLIAALPGLLLAPLLLLLPERPRSPGSGPGVLEGVREIVRVPALRRAVAGYVLNTFALNAVSAFVTSLATLKGLSAERASIAFGGVFVVAGLIGTLGGGWLSSARARAAGGQVASTLMRVAGISSLCGAPFLAAALWWPEVTGFLVLCFLAEVCIFAAVAPINSVIVCSCRPEVVTLTQGATILSINLFGALVAPNVVGALADHLSLPLALQVASVALVLSGIVWCGGRAGTGGSQSRQNHL